VREIGGANLALACTGPESRSVFTKGGAASGPDPVGVASTCSRPRCAKLTELGVGRRPGPDWQFAPPSCLSYFQQTQDAQLVWSERKSRPKLGRIQNCAVFRFIAGQCRMLAAARPPRERIDRPMVRTGLKLGQPLSKGGQAGVYGIVEKNDTAIPGAVRVRRRQGHIGRARWHSIEPVPAAFLSAKGRRACAPPASMARRHRCRALLGGPYDDHRPATSPSGSSLYLLGPGSKGLATYWKQTGFFLGSAPPGMGVGRTKRRLARTGTDAFGGRTALTAFEASGGLFPWDRPCRPDRAGA